MQVLKEDINDRILQAAIENFLESGFQLGSLRNIIKKAKISNGNFYNYFSNKEELFYAITTPFYNYFNLFLDKIFKHGSTEDFSNERIEFLSVKIADMLKEYRKEFIIIMDRSQGTKYENYKVYIIKLITENFMKNVNQEYTSDKYEGNFIMQILAINFIEAMLEISRHYKDNAWAVENIQLFLKYHFSGIAQFY